MVRAPTSSATARVSRNSRSWVPGTRPDQGQQRQQERGVGGDHHAPGAGRLAAGLKARKMTARGRPARRSPRRSGPRPGGGRSARRSTSSRLTSRPTDEEEERHQPVVDPVLEVEDQLVRADQHTGLELPEHVVRAPPIGEFTQMIASKVAATRTAADETALSATPARAPPTRWVAVCPRSRALGKNPAVSVLTPALSGPPASPAGLPVRRSVSATSTGLLSVLDRDRHRRRAT